jgi:hypothetical protein
MSRLRLFTSILCLISLCQAESKKPEVRIKPSEQAVPSDVAYALGQQSTKADVYAQQIEALQRKVDELRRDVDRLMVLSQVLKIVIWSVWPIFLTVITYYVMQRIQSGKRSAEPPKPDQSTSGP